MKPEFKEVFPCFGVDTERSNPAMIVPLGGTNMFAVLGGKNVSVTTDARNLHLHEITLAKRDADPDVTRLSALIPVAERPSTALRHDARIFTVKGTTLGGGATGGAITARLGKETAILRAVVLQAIKIKISLRDIHSLDAAGKLVRHATQKHDVPALLQVMNLVWRPQTNITFEAGETSPLMISQTLPEQLNIQEYKTLLEKGKAGAKYGMYFVAKAASRDPSSHARMDLANGFTDISTGVAIIGDSAFISTMAHEAGHLLGQDGHTAANKTHLMQDGGPGVGLGKIPFDKAIGLYNGKY